MIIKVKLDDRGRLVIPSAVRKRIGLRNRTVLLEVRDDAILIKPAPRKKPAEKSKKSTRKSRRRITKFDWTSGKSLYEKILSQSRS